MASTPRTLELVLGLLFAVAVFATFSRRLRLPYPSVLALGGLLLGLVPGLPRVEISPELVLLVFLPPLMFDAGRRISWREFRANLRPILLLAIGLVLFTTAGVGLCAHLVAGLAWGPALVLGAIVSPTDPLAAGAVAKTVRLPRRLMTILESESVTNDATGLVVYRLAVVAMVTGSLSLAQAAGSFAWASVGGTLLGLACGWLSTQIQKRIDDPPVEIALQLLTGYAAYLPAELLGFSGVFAAATAGLYCGGHASVAMGAGSRLTATAFWDTVEFLLNAVLFLLLGLQWPAVAEEAGHHRLGPLIAQGAAIAAAAIALRMVWVLAATWLPRVLPGPLRTSDPMPPWGVVALLGWAGMRGVLSLATALALPAVLASGAPLSERPAMVFFAFAVIVATLGLQGLSLPLVIRLLRIPVERGDDGGERRARLASARAARDFLAQLHHHGEEGSAVVRAMLEQHEQHLAALEQASGPVAPTHEEYRRLARELLGVQRRVLRELHQQRAIDDETLGRLERDLDLDEQRN